MLVGVFVCLFLFVCFLICFLLLLLCVCVGVIGFLNYFYVVCLLLFCWFLLLLLLFVFVFYLVGGILTGWLIKILTVYLFRNGWIEVASFSFSRKRHVRMCDFSTVGFR